MRIQNKKNNHKKLIGISINKGNDVKKMHIH